MTTYDQALTLIADQDKRAYASEDERVDALVRAIVSALDEAEKRGYKKAEDDASYALQERDR